MPDRSVAALTEKLLHLSPLDFETFVYELVLALPSAGAVRRNVRIGGTAVDVHAMVDGQPVVFEAKRFATFPVSQADAVAGFAMRARDATGATRIVLVAPAQFPPASSTVLRNAGVEVWGAPEIAARMTPDLWGRLASGRTRGRTSEPARGKAEALAAALDAIPAGNVEAIDFQKLWLDAAEFLFAPPLSIPHYEVPDEAKRNRRDIIIENFAESGFWAVARTEYVARYVVIDAKNYGKPIGKRCVIDVAHYLKRHGCGLFALLGTRAGAAGSARHAMREHWIAERKMILVLDDADLKRMLSLRADGADPAVVIREKLRCFIFSM